MTNALYGAITSLWLAGLYAACNGRVVDTTAKAFDILTSF